MAILTDEDIKKFDAQSSGSMPKVLTDADIAQLDSPKQQTQTPQPNHFGLFGSVPEDKYQQGERNIAGNIFERPAAAIRSAIQGKGYVQGAVNPTNVPTFQDMAIKSAQTSTNPVINAVAGMPASAVGLAADIITSPADVLTNVIPFTKPAQAVGKAIASTKAGQVVGKAINTPINLIKPDEQKIAEAIDTGIRKGIRPSSTGERTRNAAAAKRFDQQATSAVTDIVENKHNLSFEDANGNVVTGKLPETLQETASAMDQRMKSLTQEWQSLAEQTGKAGKSIDTADMRSQLKTLLDDPVFQTEHPADYTKVKSIYDGLEMRGKLSPADALDKVQEWNADLKGNYKTGFSYGSTKAPNVMRDMTEQLRTKLSDVIENTTGQEFQALRSKWGAYKSLIKDAQHRANIAGRANPKSIWSFMDMAGNAEIAGGVGISLMGNPAVGIPMAAKGVAMRAGKSMIQKANDPNRIVANMFKTVDKLYQAPVKTPIVPKPQPVLGLPSPKTVTPATPQYVIDRQNMPIESLGTKSGATPIPKAGDSGIEQFTQPAEGEVARLENIRSKSARYQRPQGTVIDVSQPQPTVKDVIKDNKRTIIPQSKELIKKQEGTVIPKSKSMLGNNKGSISMLKDTTKHQKRQIK